jgi:hypothetical protein
MVCPKCGFVQSGNPAECPRCGVVFAKVVQASNGAAVLTSAPPTCLQEDIARSRADREALRLEVRARAVAVPGALLGAWLAVKIWPGPVRIFTMWVHESGHAVSAWLCGYSAWPGPWATPVASEPSHVLTALLVLLLGFGGVVAWQRARWLWVAAAATGALLTLGCAVFLSRGQARQFFTFGGDAGSLVLGTALMLTMYARANNPLRTEQLRWALLMFGALAVMDAYHVWSGPLARLPFGEDEHGLSDPSVLAEEFGWGTLLLVSRYLAVARACFGVLGAAYLAGLVDAVRALRASE